MPIEILSPVVPIDRPASTRRKELTQVAHAIDERWSKAHRWSAWVPRHMAFLAAFGGRRLSTAPPSRPVPRKSDA
jgi:hypothetical protein